MQVRSCLRHGKQKEEQPEIPSSSRKSPSGIHKILKLQLQCGVLLHQSAAASLHCEALLHQPADTSLHCGALLHQPAGASLQFEALLHQTAGTSLLCEALLQQPSCASLHCEALLHQPADASLHWEALLHQPSCASLHCACAGPQTARGRRAVGDGGFAGMRLSQVMPALAPLGPRRHTNTSPHPSPSERRSSGACVLCMPSSLGDKPFLRLVTTCKA